MMLPAHWKALSLSPKSSSEKSSTNTGREAFTILTVVSGSSCIAISPETQDEVTISALSTSFRWSCADPQLSAPARISEEKSVEKKSTCSTSFLLSECFLATS